MAGVRLLESERTGWAYWSTRWARLVQYGWEPREVFEEVFEAIELRS